MIQFLLICFGCVAGGLIGGYLFAMHTPARLNPFVKKPIRLSPELKRKLRG